MQRLPPAGRACRPEHIYTYSIGNREVAWEARGASLSGRKITCIFLFIYLFLLFFFFFDFFCLFFFLSFLFSLNIRYKTFGGVCVNILFVCLFVFPNKYFDLNGLTQLCPYQC